MHRLLAAALTCVAAAILAVGAAVGVVSLLSATPEQPNVPLVYFPEHSPEEARSSDAAAPAEE
ncbi:hypothetical protein GL263_09845 [Streptomyces durbertensis]|uniref:Secreted protein n=1 Tax=Streptomyces durbertensis TaxID=2448886 RepID=A0ABR6EFJ7_9ACTN|nr:hypothetical protein [Streptomyces durbertensis]MBB1243857.1 hypothetical protein [Streptomyces durbertensis]